jgi:copper chaperone CopZ
MSTATILVSGMTCGHCVKAITEELSALDGVQEVSVELVVDGNSSVTVTSLEPLDPGAVREAVDEAGYSVVED